jgi:glycosyltransferase involved in cell wall biosynthesis
MNAPASSPTVSIIMPVYNEKETIREILQRVADVQIEKEVLVVDDGSRDGTRDALKELEPQFSSRGFRFFYQEKNQGKTAAIRFAIPQARGKITIIQDADLECNPQEILTVIAPIQQGKADVSYGNRFHLGPRSVSGYKHYQGNKLLTFLTNLVTDLNLHDMETCYKSFRTEFLQSIPIRSSRFGFEPEITIKMAQRRVRVYEVPVSYEARTYTQGKKIGLKDALQAVGVIVKYGLLTNDSQFPPGEKA